MIRTDGVLTQQDESQQTFLRYLPKRIAAFERRIQRYRSDGWEPAGMAVLSGDLQRLADASGRYDLIEPSQDLLMLAQMVEEHISSGSTPDAWQCEGMLALLSAVTGSLVSYLEPQPPSAPVGLAREPTVRHEVQGAADAKSMRSAILEPIASATGAANKTAGLTAIDESTARRVYCLSDGNPFALELGQRLETEGYEIEWVANVDELSELLLCMLPQVLLVDASYFSELPAVGAVRNDMQQRSQPMQRILMIAMAVHDDLESRRAAHRAGVDLLLFPPFDTSEIVRKMQALLTPTTEEKVRVLIVEDDRGAALFAQSVLTNAGMQAQVESDPMHVLESLKSFHPDLVLMDLHMPHANGVEVTMVIRDHPAFARLPIVFLSGESDPDSRLEAINAGGDDFLFKPIRPKHLIAAVEDRVRRVNALDKLGHGVVATKGGTTGTQRRT
ncbi:MAG TPA: response regulator [Xanthomonadaceae bacterium]|jgi:DNA-binding response OmpR family regulator|nr:response regulator [Xanthomonadaceae bacterium]